MYQHKCEHSIFRMAKVLQVSESGYYKWLKSINAPLSKKEKEDIDIIHEIYDIFRGSRGSYGSRKITVLINNNREKPVNHKRVARMMSEYMLYSRSRKRYLSTTDSDHDKPIAENLVKRVFTASSPNEKMLSDTTVVVTKQGKLYAAAILDLYGRMPVGLSMSRMNDKELVLSALEDMKMRGCGKKGCILHSDRGSTYASDKYREKLEQYGFECSMSRKGDCWDNAPMESFWGKMKMEWLSKKYDTIEAAKKDIYEYVWSFYPKLRPHESNGYLTPIEYYRRYQK